MNEINSFKEILYLILTLIPILTLKFVFSFFQISPFLNEIPSDSSVAVCVELTHFSDNIFKIHIFKPQLNFLEFWAPILLSIPRGLWPYNFFPDVLILRGQNYENITHEKFARHRIAIWGLRSAWIQKLKKTQPYLKNWGLFSSTFWLEHF